MSLVLGILLAFVVFLVVVLVHEFGHFFTARLTGMKVLEFGFGLPPKMMRIWQDAKGTEYTWNWLPIGGFVRILGEDPTREDAHKKGAFMTRPWAARVFVLIAGVTMNFLLAFVIFTGLFWVGTSPVTVNPLSDRVTNSFFIPSLPEALNSGYVHYDGIEISAISGSIAANTGIGEGEKVISIDGVTIASPQEFIALVSQDKPINLVLHNREVQRTVSVTPVDGKIGVYVGYHNLTIDKQYSRQYRLPEAILHGARETYYSSVLTLDFLSTMLHGIFAPDNATEREEAKSMLSGPIGVGATFVGLVEMSAPVSLVLIVIALISVNLGVVNLLPIPALDGGRIVTTTLYSLIVRYFQRGVDVFLQFEKYFHTIGFILLLLLTLYVAGLDISRFF